MINKDLKRTPEMARIEEREKVLRKKDIPLPGEPVDFGTPFIEAIKKVPGAEIDKMDFYYCVLRPKRIGTQIAMEFDYYGDAKVVNEVKKWNEIIASISRLICGPHILVRYGSNFNSMSDGGKKIRIKYDVIENPESSIGVIEKKIKEPMPLLGHIEKKEGIHKKNKGGK